MTIGEIGIPYKDEEIAKANRKRYYLEVVKYRVYTPEEKERKLVLSRKRDAVRRYKRKLLAINMHNNECFDCGNTYHPACYDFHHLDPKLKDFDPCAGLSKKKEVFLNEINKCVMLCSNCHRIRHSNYDSSWE